MSDARMHEGQTLESYEYQTHTKVLDEREI